MLKTIIPLRRDGVWMLMDMVQGRGLTLHSEQVLPCQVLAGFRRSSSAFSSCLRRSSSCRRSRSRRSLSSFICCCIIPFGPTTSCATFTMTAPATTPCMTGLACVATDMPAPTSPSNAAIWISPSASLGARSVLGRQVELVKRRAVFKFPLLLCAHCTQQSQQTPGVTAPAWGCPRCQLERAFMIAHGGIQPPPVHCRVHGLVPKLSMLSPRSATPPALCSRPVDRGAHTPSYFSLAQRGGLR